MTNNNPPLFPSIDAYPEFDILRDSIDEFVSEYLFDKFGAELMDDQEAYDREEVKAYQEIFANVLGGCNITITPKNQG